MSKRRVSLALLLAGPILFPWASAIGATPSSGTYPLAQLKLTIDHTNTVSVIEVNTTHGRIREQAPILGRRLHYEIRDDAGNVLLTGQKPDPRFDLTDTHKFQPVPFILSIPHLDGSSYVVIYLDEYEQTGEESYTRQQVLLEKIKLPERVAVAKSDLTAR